MNKQELIELTKELLNEEHLENRSEDLKFVKRQYKILMERDEDSLFEKQENDKFIKVVRIFEEKRNFLR